MGRYEHKNSLLSHDVIMNMSLSGHFKYLNHREIFSLTKNYIYFQFNTPTYTQKLARSKKHMHPGTHANKAVNQGEVRDIFMLIHISLKLKKRTEGGSD